MLRGVSDEALRRLEREAEPDDPQACLRLARALSRAGRPLDAVRALERGAPADVEVRRELARLPRDLPPLRRAPRVRWETTLRGRDPLEGAPLATPLGVAVPTRRRTLLLDPRTGAVRCEHPPGRLFAQDEVLLILRTNLTLHGIDLWTGEQLHAERLVGRARAASAPDARVAHGLLVTTRGRDALAWRLPDPRRPPEAGWTARLGVERAAVGPVTRGLVVINDAAAERTPQRAGAVRVLDARDGRERLRLDGRCLAADDELLVLDAAPALDAWATAAVAPDGALRWRVDDVTPIGLTADHVVALRRAGRQGRGAWEVVTLDRATGARRAAVPVGLPVSTSGEALYRWSGAVLEAATLDGTRLWRWAPRRAEGLAPFDPPQPLPGAVVVRVATRTIVCLEETPPS